jgi:hypothetical protein
VRRLVFLAGLCMLLLVPATASAVTVSKAQLIGGQLRVEGSGAAPGGSVVIARSTTGAASARIDTKGGFRIQAGGFRSDDCLVVVSDGTTPIAQATLSGCRPVVTPPIADPPPPSGSCVIAPAAPATFTVGDLQSFFFVTSGCDTSRAPVQWSLVAGRIPPGMDAPISQGQTAGMVGGRPTTEGTYDFSVRVTDSAGATDVETFTIVVVGPRPLSTTTPATLPPATRGLAYQVNLGADGGLPGYAWALRSGTLPPGLRLSSAPVAAVAGTPTAPGTFTFTVTVTDSRGTASDKTLTLTVN